MSVTLVDPRRARRLNTAERPVQAQCVMYWMSRDQRAQDNPALLYAQEWALKLDLPLRVVFALTPMFPGATDRHYQFMLAGLEEVEQTLRRHNVSFQLLDGDPADEVPRAVHAYAAALVVADFSPLRIGRAWRDTVAQRLSVPLYEVDAHNIVPAWLASDKEEHGAYTFRPKIKRLLPEYLTDLPPLQPHPHGDPENATDWAAVRAALRADTSVAPAAGFAPGETAARAALDTFLTRRLAAYAHNRNNPAIDGQSDLSPYFHFGQLAPQRAAWEAARCRDEDGESVDAFLEELIVRRELSDNFCLYQPAYDSAAAFKGWAKKTLDDHRADRRPHLYTRDELEFGRTADLAWNAAQAQMVRHGKMHNYLRMYWGKKLLEWSASPEEALETAIALNDRYELDGRDPNGYTGVAWCIGGIHDRPWPERPIFGKIRYMNFAGLKRKFDVDAYIRANPPLS
ncbi:MAG: deoxyribodipyrimidine photo-lyase [Anaerolineae bacterium]